MIIAPMAVIFNTQVTPPWWLTLYYSVAFALLGISLGFAFYSAVLYVYSAFFEKDSVDDSQADKQVNEAPLPPLQ